MSSRTWRLAAVTAFAVIAVTAAIVASSASSEPEAKATVKPEAAGLLEGIPESKGVLGAANAPITVTEFVDPQCPVCAAASKQVLPTLIDDYVRTGKVKLDAEVLHFLGPDSVKAARYATGARAQDKLWPFLETFFASQGTENSGYVTKGFLTQVAEAAGVDPARAAAHAPGDELGTANAEAQRLGVTGTPTFVIKRADGKEQVVDAGTILQALGVMRLRLATAAVATVGLAVAIYLVAAAGEPACFIAHGCTIVQNSEYAELGGIPVATLGLIGYAAILATLVRDTEATRTAGAGLALVGAGFSGWLTYVELVKLDAICAWCVVSAICMALLAGLTVTQLLRPTGRAA